jgi:hypothetical protein
MSSILRNTYSCKLRRSYRARGSISTCVDGIFLRTTGRGRMVIANLTTAPTKMYYLFFLESCGRRTSQSIAESHSSESKREHPQLALPPSRSFLEIDRGTGEKESKKESMEDLLEPEQRGGGGGEQQVVYCAVGKKEAGREWNWKANLLWVLANLPRRNRLVFLHLHRPASRINMSTFLASCFLSPSLITSASLGFLRFF